MGGFKEKCEQNYKLLKTIYSLTLVFTNVVSVPLSFLYAFSEIFREVTVKDCEWLRLVFISLFIQN